MVRLSLALSSMVLALSAADRVSAGSDVLLPFKSCGGMICIPVTLADGTSHQLLLDTGNVSSWILADTARGMGLKLEPIEQDGKVVPGISRLGAQKVALQGRPLEGRFLAISREQTGELPPEVEGALAYTLFKDKVVQIDYPHLTVRVLEPAGEGNSSAGGDLKLVTFGKEGPPIVVGNGFSINGRPVAAQIDTCFTGTLLVYDAAIGQLGLQRAAAQARPRYFPYTDGGVDMNEAAAQELSFGSYVLSPRPATIYFSGKGKNPVHQPDGLFEATAGNALFAHSVVTLDFHTMRISVRPG